MNNNKDLIQDLEERAKIIRRHVVKVIHDAGVGHPGGSLSAVDILTVLYFHTLRIDPDNPNWEDRDRFILSKGHASSALYSTLAERGFFSTDLLSTFGRINSRLQVHPDMRKLPGIEASTGALGQGLSIAIGMALGARLDKKDLQIYVLLGDGEIQEGQIWEAAMSAAHYKVDSLTAILDYNGVQLMGPVSAIMEVAPVKEKWVAFGWNVIEIDGHSIKEIINSFDQARAFKGKPTIILANTVKGKGCSFMEGKCEWHGKTPSNEELCRALSELE
ncbi:MAG: transketolase [Candidatus Fischerbacteria bacterium RBG_13_37_8]|uniref:Transketolase n=1 Tax=Candidatus Fischerbacteria bacterium RBG_13_37_8 TaxID=1817863 RepID=A0A1F5V6U1_9BACT|nr:MAG: transketolase [Candidatus Fischerbacteria bacterium RBG_13_37_8]